METLNLSSHHYNDSKISDTFTQTFDSLPMGDKFIVTSDKDINSLINNLEKEYKNLVEYEYIKEGPEEWEAIVSKKYYNFI